jgi:DNA polymerase-3 subunit alpha
MNQFTHVHCHTQYSLLDGAAKIDKLVAKAKQLGMGALAITDHGNMFGVAHFVMAAQKEKMKALVGCEFYMAPDMHDTKDKTRYHQLILAINQTGYQNLSKLCSLGFLEGYYYKPRIDKKLLKKHIEGLIATTCCLAGEVPQAILKKGEEAAEKVFLEWLDLFGSNYYIELQRHGIPEQEICNQVLLRWAKKYQVKAIATNDVHYIVQQDSVAQDILLCLQTGKDYNDPNRMRFEGDQFYLKSPQDMLTLFSDVPEAISNTQEIVDKITTPQLQRDILLPLFQVPTGFNNQDAYLRHLALEGAAKRYPNLTPAISQRIDYELTTIEKMGFPGYFLIVQDFIQAAKQLDVIVGPGRGSVGGSVVAYCIGITSIDPIQYNLVFERFLNPERINMPDIDIDFDDEGRQKVIAYVANKYGKNQVAHITTFGSMAAKSAIRDVARVLGLPLAQADHMAKLVPEKLGITLTQAFDEVPELANLKKDNQTLASKVLTMAETLEGCARHAGVHAAGIIIAPNDLLEYIPVKTDKHSDLLVTQYDGSVVEQVGMLKMDFLGLKTLTILKDAVALVVKNGHDYLELDKLPLDDAKTFELYQRGDTIGTFQFESEGMRQWLKKLQPTQFEDLVAMNALYRPGPMQFIPNFIARKHGHEKIEYPHPMLEALLAHTYGIMVYQEQVMQTAQLIAGYSLGQADILRKAMGKKMVEEMAKQRQIFVKGAQQKHNLPAEKAIEIFNVMERFAQYGFPRAHSVSYSLIAYQTAYLKAHYPAEYMAAVLTHNKHDIEKVGFFMEETRRQGVAVLGPDINESHINFHVNKAGKIRFGLSAIKGMGQAAVENIIKLREEDGKFQDLYTFAERIECIEGKIINRRTLESLALSGALDGLAPYHRKQYIWASPTETPFIEKLAHYARQLNQEKAAVQQSLFAASATFYQPKQPTPPDCEPYSLLEQLDLEKELLGFYIAGHPLDPFKVELQYFCNCTTENFSTVSHQELRLAGLVAAANVKTNKQGRSFAIITLEDHAGSLPIMLFGEDFLRNQHLLQKGLFLYLVGLRAPRYNQPDAWDFKPQKISLLADIRNKLTKTLSLTLPLHAVEPPFITTLKKICEDHVGNCGLQLQVAEPTEGISVTLQSTYHINPTNTLLRQLAQWPEVSYQLLTGPKL